VRLFVYRIFSQRSSSGGDVDDLSSGAVELTGTSGSKKLDTGTNTGDEIDFGK
jgi:hypothetical protein